MLLERGAFRIEPAAGITAAPADPLGPVPETVEPHHGNARLSWRELASRGEYGAALAAAQRADLDVLFARLSAPDLMRLAEVARLARAPVEVHRALVALSRRFPDSAEARLPTFLRGRIAMDLENDLRSAVPLLGDYLEVAPFGDFAEEARGRRMQALERLGEVAEARRAAEDYLTRHPRGSHAVLARSILAR